MRTHCSHVADLLPRLLPYLMRRLVRRLVPCLALCLEPFIPTHRIDPHTVGEDRVMGAHHVAEEDLQPPPAHGGQRRRGARRGRKGRRRRGGRVTVCCSITTTTTTVNTAARDCYGRPVHPVNVGACPGQWDKRRAVVVMAVALKTVTAAVTRQQLMKRGQGGTTRREREHQAPTLSVRVVRACCCRREGCVNQCHQSVGGHDQARTVVGCVELLLHVEPSHAALGVGRPKQPDDQRICVHVSKNAPRRGSIEVARETL